MANPHIRILVADDHPTVRAGVAAITSVYSDIVVCGEACTGWQAVERTIELSPDVVVQDVTLPELDGIEVLRQIKKSKPAIEVVIYSGNASEQIVYQAFDAGARSYILKTDSALELVEAIRAAAAHKPYFTPRISEIVFSRFQTSAGKGERPLPGEILTAREREALQIIAEGKSNKELAAALNVSLRTAESHRAAIMQRLGLKSIGELIRYAIRNGIIHP